MDHDHDHDHDHGAGGGHEGDDGHAGHGMNMKCPMIMSFHAGACETILWPGLVANTVGSFVGACVVIFLVSFAYEGLKYLREKYYITCAEQEAALAREQAKLQNSESATGCCSNSALAQQQKTTLQRVFNKAHGFQTFIHMVQLIISYLLMLIFMTFNYWLCLSVILGCGLGYFCFGWIRQQAVDANEHCH